MSSLYNRPSRVNRNYRHPATEYLRNLERPPRESRDRAQFRRSVLRQFRCPYREESTCKNEARPTRCLFGHGPVDEDDSSSPQVTNEQQALSCNVPINTVLRQVPSYSCIYSLIGCCQNETRNSENSLDISPDVGCKNGLHLVPEEMIDLDYFETKHSELIANYFGVDHDRECYICFDKVLRKCVPGMRRFGILESCLHVFCSTCINQWRNRSFNCPVCRVYSARVATRAKFVETMDERKQMFPPLPSTAALPCPRLEIGYDGVDDDGLPPSVEMFIIRPYDDSDDDDLAVLATLANSQYSESNNNHHHHSNRNERSSDNRTDNWNRATRDYDRQQRSETTTTSVDDWWIALTPQSQSSSSISEPSTSTRTRGTHNQNSHYQNHPRDNWIFEDDTSFNSNSSDYNNRGNHNGSVSNNRDYNNQEYRGRNGGGGYSSNYRGNRGSSGSNNRDYNNREYQYRDDSGGYSSNYRGSRGGSGSNNHDYNNREYQNRDGGGGGYSSNYRGNRGGSGSNNHDHNNREYRGRGNGGGGYSSNYHGNRNGSGSNSNNNNQRFQSTAW